jgi:hypothetical protein
MEALANLKAIVASAQAGRFSGAARQLGKLARMPNIASQTSTIRIRKISSVAQTPSHGFKEGRAGHRE